jgi:hypothetical protein
MVRAAFRLLWVAIAFALAGLTALVALFWLGGTWVGEELRDAALDDPFVAEGAPVLGTILFAGTVFPALTALPGVLATVIGEALRIRSWVYYVLAGGATLAAVPFLAGGLEEAPPLPDYLTIFAAAGFIGGFAYWLIAGRNA